MSVTNYISRRLYWRDRDGNRTEVDEVALTAEALPFVVLGDPGIGKTELMKQLGEQSGYHYLTAAHFLRLPLNTLPSGILLLDALDEVSAGRESDPLDRVLSKLGNAGWPAFALSCRAADWRGNVHAMAIAEDYGHSARTLTLEPLTRAESHALLEAKIGSTHTAPFLEVLYQHGLSDLLANPQTLRMLIEVADRGAPASRAELFERATLKMLAEHNEAHVQSALNAVAPAPLLDAAGAAMAMLLISGKEGLFTGLQTKTPPQLEPVAEISALPLAGHCHTVLHSRLFRTSGESDSFKDCHRTVAEYLGARWLGRVVDTSNDPYRMVKRLLALFRSAGRIPASLRGLHAWLAHHSHYFAQPVIDADPYGAMRYGDLGAASLAQAEQVWDSLARESTNNPWFRAGDWHRFQVASLVQPGLGELLGRLLADKKLSFHLHSLILDLLPNGGCVPEMHDILLRIVRDTARSYSERHDAVIILAGQNAHGVDWPALFLQLCEAGDTDAPRLVDETIGHIGIGGFSDAQIATVAFSLCGGFYALGMQHRISHGDHWQLTRTVPLERCADVLDALLTRFAPNADGAPFAEHDRGFGELVHTLIARQIPGPPIDPVRLWRWLDAFAEYQGSDYRPRTRVAAWIAGNEALRRAIQSHLFLSDEGHQSQQRRHWHFASLSSGLLFQEEDTLALLTLLEASKRTDAAAEACFGALARGWHSDDNQPPPASITAALERCATDNPARHAVLHPVKSAPDRKYRRWARQLEERERKKAEKRRRRQAADRGAFLEAIDSIRAGEGSSALLALCFLGYGEFGGRDTEPEERIAMWVGADLHGPALIGFEAALHRPLDTTPAEVTTRHLARDNDRDPIWSVVAGLAQRHRDRRGFAGISKDHLMAALITKQLKINVVDKHFQGFGEALHEAVDRDEHQFERYLRALIEPQLGDERHYVIGTRYLLDGRLHHALRIRLLLEWFTPISNTFATDQEALVDALLDAPSAFAVEAGRQVDELIVAAPPRIDGTDRTLYWTALKLVRDFEGSRAELEQRAAADRELLWGLAKAVGYSKFGDRKIRTVPLHHLAWIFERFEVQWPDADRPRGTSHGSQNPWDAADFLRALLFRIAEDTSPAAVRLLHAMTIKGSASYGESLRAALARQRAKAAEIEHVPPPVATVAAALREQSPRDPADVRAIVLEAIARVQARLKGSATDPVNLFYNADVPKDEGQCRNALLDLLCPTLPFGIVWSPEERMPREKRADAGFRLGEMRIPLEAKLAWNDSLWTAPTAQLDRLYASADYLAGGHGIYLVFWFGPADATGRRIPAAPSGEIISSAAELKALLETQCFAGESDRLSVVVLDVSRDVGGAD